jgi:hypothetical protein
VQLVFSCKCVISLLQSPSPRLQGRGTAHFTLIPKRLFIGDQAALQLHMCPNSAGRTLAAPTQAPLKWGDAGHRLADISLMLSTNPRGPKWQTLSRGLSGGGDGCRRSSPLTSVLTAGHPLHNQSDRSACSHKSHPQERQSLTSGW